MQKRTGLVALAAATGVLAPGAMADVVSVRVHVQNMAPARSVSFAPLRVGFNSGVYDAFNEGQAPGAAIISIAEGGSGSDWFPAFASADPGAVLGSVLPNPAGPLTPGATGFADFTVDTDVNPFFTFAAMVVPSNDHFIGNDDPQAYRLFDAGGQLAIGSISQFGSSVWDNGSEIEDPMAAAFLVGGTNSLRTEQNGVVNFNFDKLDTFNGLTTAAGYVFDRQFGASDEIYRISFEIVPAPGGLAVLGLGGVAMLRRRR